MLPLTRPKTLVSGCCRNLGFGAMGTGNRAETKEITGQSDPVAGPPTPPRGDPGGTPSRARALPSAPETLVGVLFLLLSAFSALFPLLGPFWHDFDLILEPLGLQKTSIFIETNSSFSLFSLRTLPGRMEIIENKSKLHTQAPQKLSQSSPGALRSLPGEPQELPKTTPGALGGHP